MSTVATTGFVPAAALAYRFLWKEYRMLRGFWLALLVLMLGEQLVSLLILDDPRTIAAWLFASAWGGAALYAVGAAITLFSAENEERTRDYLQLLPVRWGPMFAGKLVIAVGSAVALAGVLMLTGWWLAGGQWPVREDAVAALAIAGVAVVEVTVWGLFFSLLWRQPLLAAVAAMAAASFGAQLAIASTTYARDTFSAESYQVAVPARLLLCLGVFAVDVLLARRWLVPTGSRPFTNKSGRATTASATAAGPRRASRRTMFARLTWQSWRQSWKTLLAVFPLSALLTIAYLIPVELYVSAGWQMDVPIHLLVTLLLPALFGALAFRADQKGDHRQFLATHAAKPRMVWLTRHLVWLGSLFVLAFVLQLVVNFMNGVGVQQEFVKFLRGTYYTVNFFGVEYPTSSNWAIASLYQDVVSGFFRGATLAWCAAFSAYALGQLASMLLRSEVLAGFIAVVLSMVLAAWGLVVSAWQLNPLWSVLPIGIGAMLATWLWAPRWLVGVRSWPVGFVTGLAVILPLVLIGWKTPGARLAQLPEGVLPPAPYLAGSLKASSAALSRDVRKGEAVSLQIEQLLAVFMEEAAQRRAQFGASTSVLARESEQHLAQNLVEIIENASGKVRLNPHSRFELLLDLLKRDAARLTRGGELQPALDRYCAAVRLLGYLMTSQPPMYVNELQPVGRSPHFASIADGLQKWALHEDQTSDQIIAAIADLDASFGELPLPRETLLADYQRFRDALADDLALGLPSENVRASTYLAYLANLLPWERERSLRALDVLVTLQLHYADAVVAKMAKIDAHREFVQAGFWGAILVKEDNPDVRILLRAAPWESLRFANEIVFNRYWAEYQLARQLESQALTSHLVVEFLHRHGEFSQLLQGWVEMQTRQRALAVELALLAYWLDHGDYPQELAQLTPDYLEHPRYDPFSGEHFEYAPQGYPWPIAEYNNRPEIPAKTPVLWSVGSGNFELVEQIELEGFDRWDDANWGYGTASEPDPETPGRTVLQSRAQEEGRGWYNAELFFRLPK